MSKDVRDAKILSAALANTNSAIAAKASADDALAFAIALG